MHYEWKNLACSMLDTSLRKVTKITKRFISQWLSNTVLQFLFAPSLLWPYRGQCCVLTVDGKGWPACSCSVWLCAFDPWVSASPFTRGPSDGGLLRTAGTLVVCECDNGDISPDLWLTEEAPTLTVAADVEFEWRVAPLWDLLRKTKTKEQTCMYQKLHWQFR